MKATYIPRDPADPHRVRMAGLVFEANVACEINEATHPEAARNVRVNPWFDVAGEAAKAKGGRPAHPKTAEEYRAFAINWITKVESARGLNDRWATEETMRESLGVSGDDLDAIGLIMQPKLHGLKQMVEAE